MGRPLANVAHRAHQMHRAHRVPRAHCSVAAAALVSLAGCAQVLGIEETNGNGRPVDSLAVTRMSVGATVETNPLDLSNLAATYLVARKDGSGVDPIAAAAGQDPG